MRDAALALYDFGESPGLTRCADAEFLHDGLGNVGAERLVEIETIG